MRTQWQNKGDSNIKNPDINDPVNPIFKACFNIIFCYFCNHNLLSSASVNFKYSGLRYNSTAMTKALNFL